MKEKRRLIKAAASWLWVAAVPALALLLSFLICSLLLKLYNADPVVAYTALFRGALVGKYNFSETIAIMIPLLLIALGIAVAQTGDNQNIGGEGQFHMGALGAAFVAIYLPANTPVLFSIPLLMATGALFGMVWILLPAVLKIKRGVSEIVMTVMMNEIGKGIVSCLLSNGMKDPNSPIHQTVEFGENWKLPTIIPDTKIHLGFVLALILTVILWVYLNKMTGGYEVKAVGQCKKAAQYAGMRVGKVALMTFLLSGALAGLAGACEVSGIYNRLIEGFSLGFGFTAIVISLLGKRNPLKIAIAAFCFAALITGANAMQRAVGTPATLASVIQAVTVFFWMISEFFVSQLRKKINLLKCMKSTQAIPSTSN